MHVNDVINIKYYISICGFMYPLIIGSGDLKGYFIYFYTGELSVTSCITHVMLNIEEIMNSKKKAQRISFEVLSCIIEI